MNHDKPPQYYRECHEQVKGKLTCARGDLRRTCGEGRCAKAIQRFDECLALYRRLGSQPDVAQTLHNLASTYATGLGDPVKALPLAREAAELARRLERPDAADYDELVAEIAKKVRR